MQQEMSFADHLLELRSRILKSLAALAACAVASFFFWREILSFFTGWPLHLLPDPPKLIYTAPVDGFMVSIQISVFAGLALAAPLIFYQIWRFVAPGLFRNEIKLVLPTLFFSTLFFLGGMAFAYFLVLPQAFRFLLSYAPAELSPMLSINVFIGFIVKLSAAFGLVFELPVFTFVLVRLGMVTPRFLVKNFRYAVVIIFILAAVLTPTPDAFTQLMMAAPLMVLYGLSIGVAWLAGRKHA